MRVKQLEWVPNENQLNSTNGLYSLCESLLLGSYVGTVVVYNTLSKNIIIQKYSVEDAKQACQDYFEKLILSQIYEISFDPKLLGFDLLQDYEEETNYIKTTNVINELGFTSAFRLHYIKGRDTWLLKFCKSAKVEELIFPEVKIPNHDFGETLINQYLNTRSI